MNQVNGNWVGRWYCWCDSKCRGRGACQWCFDLNYLRFVIFYISSSCILALSIAHAHGEMAMVFAYEYFYAIVSRRRKRSVDIESDESRETHKSSNGPEMLKKINTSHKCSHFLNPLLKLNRLAVAFLVKFFFLVHIFIEQFLSNKITHLMSVEILFCFTIWISINVILICFTACFSSWCFKR